LFAEAVNSMEKIFTAWLWESRYDYLKVNATTQEEADTIANAWELAGYPKGEELSKQFPQIVEWK
jgi:hypothetical protein